MNVIKKSFDLGDGRIVEIETGKLAKQADGSVVVKMGDTMLLATVVSTVGAKPGTDFLPLSVDYQEKYAATGRIPGGFLRREARLSDYEVLISRLVDRALRPLFPSDYHSDTQVMISLISADKNIMPDCLAGLAASAALAVSDIPFNGPISEVRVAKIDGNLVINPYASDLERATLEFMVAGSANDIVMVEGECDEIQEEEMVEALKFAHEAIKVQCAVQVELTEATGKTVKREYNHEDHDDELKAKVYADTYDKVYAIAKSGSTKEERSEAFTALITEFLEAMPEETEDLTKALAKHYYHDVQYDAVRALLLDEGIRLDGRATTQIRPIWSEVGYLPAAHGSAVFTRGETQSLTSVTLGSKDDEQMIDGAFINGYNKFLLHYNFPGFSTGEVRPNRGAGRREIGHGALAQRSLKKVLPEGAENPYTIRIVSDILESNGSSSMATVCAGTLALMDAGIKIKSPVSGIAMGLITDEKTGKYAILSDILGDEDHLGDMDFKVTGTSEGITACQMDIKIDGLKYEIMEQALAQARDGRLHILGKILETLDKPNNDVKVHAPKIIMRTIPGNFIGALIGPGGKVIQELQKATGCTIVINEVDEQGVVEILGTDPDGIAAVLAKIDSIIFKPTVGEAYEVKVIKMLDFGAVVEYTAAPGNEVLLHVSELAWERTENVSDVVNMGDVFEVKYLGLDPKTRKEKVSRKALLPRPPREEKKE